jgi:hypothetical protein
MHIKIRRAPSSKRSMQTIQKQTSRRAPSQCAQPRACPTQRPRPGSCSGSAPRGGLASEQDRALQHSQRAIGCRSVGSAPTRTQNAQTAAAGQKSIHTQNSRRKPHNGTQRKQVRTHIVDGLGETCDVPHRSADFDESVGAARERVRLPARYLRAVRCVNWRLVPSVGCHESFAARDHTLGV